MTFIPKNQYHVIFNKEEMEFMIQLFSKADNSILRKINEKLNKAFYNIEGGE